MPYYSIFEKILKLIGLSGKQLVIFSIILCISTSGAFILGRMENTQSPGSVKGLEADIETPSKPSSNDLPPQVTQMPLEFLSHDKDWDLRSLKKQSDGYYCPDKPLDRDYYYTWYKSRVSLLGKKYIKFQIRPKFPNLENTSGEGVIKIGRSKFYEITEFYFPARNKETVQYKQPDTKTGKLEFLLGEQLTTIAKSDEPTEILTDIVVSSKNKVQSNYTIDYLGKNKGEIVDDSFNYSPFLVSETDPKDISTDFGFGVDLNSCFKIQKYCFDPLCIPS